MIFIYLGAVSQSNCNSTTDLSQYFKVALRSFVELRWVPGSLRYRNSCVYFNTINTLDTYIVVLTPYKLELSIHLHYNVC